MSKINKRSSTAELVDLRTRLRNGRRSFQDTITFPVGDQLEIVRRRYIVVKSYLRLLLYGPSDGIRLHRGAMDRSSILLEGCE
jgi:hypothetical protein